MKLNDAAQGVVREWLNYALLAVSIDLANLGSISVK